MNSEQNEFLFALVLLNTVQILPSHDVESRPASYCKSRFLHNFSGRNGFEFEFRVQSICFSRRHKITSARRLTHVSAAALAAGKQQVYWGRAIILLSISRRLYVTVNRLLH